MIDIRAISNKLLRIARKMSKKYHIPCPTIFLAIRESEEKIHCLALNSSDIEDPAASDCFKHDAKEELYNDPQKKFNIFWVIPKIVIELSEKDRENIENIIMKNINYFITKQLT